MTTTVWREAWVQTDIDGWGHPYRRLVIRECREISQAQARRAIPMGGPRYALWQLRSAHWMQATPSGRSIQAADKASGENVLEATAEERAYVEKAIAGSMFFSDAPLRWVSPGDTFWDIETFTPPRVT